MSNLVLQGTSIAQDLYVSALSSVYNNFRLYDPDFALTKEPDAYEKVRRDPIVAHAIDQRLHRVAGSRWFLTAGGEDDASKALVDIFTPLLKYIENFDEALYETAQAVIRARSFSFIEGQRLPLALGGGDVLQWWTPTKLTDVDRRRFRRAPDHVTDKEGNRRLIVREELYSVTRETWEVLEHPEWFVKHIYNDEEARTGHGRGLLESIYWYHWCKGKVLREGIQGVERWAQGIVVGKIDGLRPASKTKTNDTQRTNVLRILQEMRGRNVFAFGKDDDIRVIETSGSGHQMVIDFLKYLDNAITRLILGSVLSTGGDLGTGSLGRAEVEARSVENLIAYDRRILNKTISRDLIGLMFKLNRQNLQALGLGGAMIPEFHTVHDATKDPLQAAQIIEILLRSGVKLKASQVYELTGFSKPEDGDDIIEAPAQIPAAAFGAPNLSDAYKEILRSHNVAA